MTEEGNDKVPYRGGLKGGFLRIEPWATEYELSQVAPQLIDLVGDGWQLEIGRGGVVLYAPREGNFTDPVDSPYGKNHAV